LSAFSDDGAFNHWAVVNAHAGAGQNVLQIQRPTAFTSDKSYLIGTSKAFDQDTSQLQYGKPQTSRRPQAEWRQRLMLITTDSPRR
jgi:hypothetical protein